MRSSDEMLRRARGHDEEDLARLGKPGRPDRRWKDNPHWPPPRHDKLRPADDWVIELLRRACPASAQREQSVISTDEQRAFDLLAEHLMKLTFLDLERGFRHRYDFEQESR
jgi:hypothetical protein